MNDPDPILVLVRQKKHRLHRALFRWYETRRTRTEAQLNLFGSLLLLGAALIRLAVAVTTLFTLMYGSFLIIGVFAGYVQVRLP